MKVVVYRSEKRANTYLYVEPSTDLDDLPELLMQNFPEPESFLEFELSADRKLQQADPLKVMESIASQGFYLQLPPQKQDDVLAN